MSHATAEAPRIELLGGFRAVVDDHQVESDQWPSRRAAELVQLLALAEGKRLLRDQVVEALWPHLEPSAGSANLRKAAHHARQALGRSDSIELRGGQVRLFPEHIVSTDVDDFEYAAERALLKTDPHTCALAARSYGGELLPEARYEEWTQLARDRLHSRYLDLLRHARQWDSLFEADPTDEQACRALMAASVSQGNVHKAVRLYRRLCTALDREMGIGPSAETEALYADCIASLRPDESIVGRQAELAQIEAAVSAGWSTSLGLFALRGTAGIGKTVLCRSLCFTARQQGFHVLTVPAAGDRGPYGLLAGVLEELLGRRPDLTDVLSARAQAVLAEFTAVGTPSPTLDIPLSRHHVIGVARRLFVAAAESGEILLAVDDAHRADDASIEALLHLTGADERLLVALAYRRESASDTLTRGVARLSRAGMADTLDLGPLGPEDAAALVTTVAPVSPSPESVARMIELARGNPFFLIELARSIGSAKEQRLPTTVSEAVIARCVDLDENTRQRLQRLAVAGDELDLAGVVAVAGLAEPETYAMLDSALAAGVLVVSGSHYQFRHDLVRQALAAQVPPHRRVSIHRDAAGEQAAAGGRPEVIARHWLAADRPNEAGAWLLAAARDAMRVGAFSDALTLVDRVLDHNPHHFEALYICAEILEALGDRRAPAAFAAAAGMVDAPQRHEIRAKQALASIRTGDPEAAIETLAGVQAQTLEGRLCQCLALCGAAAMGFADPQVGVVRAAETRALAVESGDSSAIVIATWAEAAAAHAAGQLPSRLQASLLDTHALPELAVTVFDGQLCVVERLLYGGLPYPKVLSFADALGAQAEQLKAARGYAFAVTLRGEARLLTGQLDHARADLIEGARLHREIGAVAGESLSLQRLAEVALHRGQRRDAEALLDESLALARDSNLGFHLLDRIYGTRIECAADPAAALAALDEAEDAVHGSLETCPGCRITFAVPAAIAAARAGDLARAAAYGAVVDRLTTILMRLPGWFAALREVRGVYAWASEDRATAMEHLDAAARDFRRVGQPLDARRCEGRLAEVR